MKTHFRIKVDRAVKEKKKNYLQGWLTHHNHSSSRLWSSAQRVAGACSSSPGSVLSQQGSAAPLGAERRRAVRCRSLGSPRAKRAAAAGPVPPLVKSGTT